MAFIQHRPSARMHNWYAEFLKSFKHFIDKVTAHQITKYEFDYGSKTKEYFLLHKNQSFEYPTCTIEMQDLSLIDGVGPIARNAMHNVNPSNHNIILAENLTTYETILLDKRHVNITIMCTISCEDSAQLMNTHDLFISQLPMNFSFYDYQYINYLEVTDFIQDWDLENHNISNIFEKKSITNGYTDLEHDHSNPIKYFSSLMNQPVLEMTSCTKNVQKEQQRYSLNVTFEAMIEIPNILRTKSLNEIKSFNLIIDTGSQNQLPIIIDIPENIASTKNILRTFILDQSNFNLDSKEEIISIEVESSLVDLYCALWVVQDTTNPSSKRFFIPLKNAKITQVGTKSIFIFNELSLFKDFEYDNTFSKIELIVFKDPV